ncbi:hypothetical protein CRX72_12375 [Pantoea sp. BRM17]|nr:hypothetical protein CRX72_12375 [Pantoea sp. BRM17]
MASEDFACMLEACPGAYFWLGADGEVPSAPLHNASYDFNDALLPVGITFWQKLVESVLAKPRCLQPEVRERVRGLIEEFVTALPRPFGVSGDIHWYPGYPVTANHPAPAQQVREVAEQMLGDAQVKYGRSCHAAMPESGADPMVVAAELVLALQTIPSRRLSPLASAVVSVTQIHGGEAINVIPEQITLRGTGTIHFLFQPAEENLGGARRMTEEGLFSRFPMDAVYAMHNWPGLPLGTLAVNPGAMMASLDSFEITLSIGTLENGPGPVIGLRADMDALPITEKGIAAWKSTRPGVMHACGHDGHTAILLAAACQLAATRDFSERWRALQTEPSVMSLPALLLENALNWRHQLHQLPELGYQEQQTSELVARVLEQAGLQVFRGIAGTGELRAGAGVRRAARAEPADANVTAVYAGKRSRYQ